MDERSVTMAAFEFTAEVQSRGASARIRAVLGALPDRVATTEHAEHEEEHVESTGAGAPTRRYAYRVRATIAGPSEHVLEVRRRLQDIQGVRLGRLRAR